MTVASGSGLDVADVGRKIPVAVFWFARKFQRIINLHELEHTVSALKRWTRTRSRRGMTALMDLKVA